MGTNYYWHAGPPCKECGHQGEGLHIGKSSAGWCFSLRVHPSNEPPIKSLTDWMQLFAAPGSEIRNEYGQVVPSDEMHMKITNRRCGGGDAELHPDWYRRNSAQPGPNGLARHKIDGRCIGHGEGTWDLLVGEFS